MKSVLPSEIDGKVKAPPSKSLTIRALAAALLAPKESVIISPSSCVDARVALDLIQGLGAKVKVLNDRVHVHGGFPGISPLSPEGSRLSCGESGLTMRLFAPLVVLQPHPIWLDGEGTLLRRPMDMLEAPLQKLGARCQTQAGLPPVFVQGPLHPGRLTVEASRTSQFLSGLVMALPLLSGDSEVIVTQLKSRPYVEMTIELLKEFQVQIQVQRNPDIHLFRVPGLQRYRPACYRVEGDWSGAAFLLVAASLRGRIEVIGLDIRSKQADTKILEALGAAGARVLVENQSVIVEKAALQPFEFDASDCPDLFPPLSVLAAGCPGRSRILGADRLAYKESHRGKALVSELGKIGVDIRLEPSCLIVSGGPIRGGATRSHSDHRIAMACAVAGLISREGVRITGWEDVNKSYPDFFAALKSIGGKIR